MLVQCFTCTWTLCVHKHVAPVKVSALGSVSKAWRFSGSSDFPILVRGELILVAWHAALGHTLPQFVCTVCLQHLYLHNCNLVSGFTLVQVNSDMLHARRQLCCPWFHCRAIASVTGQRLRFSYYDGELVLCGSACFKQRQHPQIYCLFFPSTQTWKMPCTSWGYFVDFRALSFGA